MSRRRFTALAVFGLIAPWFSFSVVFVLAGVGLHLLVTELLRKDRRQRGDRRGHGPGLARQLRRLLPALAVDPEHAGFHLGLVELRVPAHSPAVARPTLSLLAETLANVFINPGSLLCAAARLPVTAVAGVGAGDHRLRLAGPALAGRALPGDFARCSSRSRPRGSISIRSTAGCCSTWCPTYLLLLAEGIAAIGRHTGWLVTLALAGFFLYGQAAEIVWHKAIQPRVRPFDSHGDLKNDLLDYLESRSVDHAGPASRDSPGPMPARSRGSHGQFHGSAWFLEPLP